MVVEVIQIILLRRLHRLELVMENQKAQHLLTNKVNEKIQIIKKDEGFDYHRQNVL